MTQEEVELPQVHIAVLGPPLAGKSTFIEHALDLKESPVSSSSCKKVSLEGSIYLVHLVELDSSNCASDTGDLLWPDGRKSVPFAYFDGVLLLFDMTNQESFESLSDILRTCTHKLNLKLMFGIILIEACTYSSIIQRSNTSHPCRM